MDNPVRVADSCITAAIMDLSSPLHLVGIRGPVLPQGS